MAHLKLALLLFFSSLACVVGISAAQAGPTDDPYAAYKYSRDMPRSIEDWVLARSRMDADPAWKKWVDSERVRLQRWQARGGDHPDWVAGYMHDYFDPATLKEIQWTEDTPLPPTGLPGTPEAKRFGGWVFYFRTRNASYVLLAARIFKLTGDRQALDWARSQIDLYTRQYSRWPMQTRAGSKTRLMSSSLDEAQVMVMLVPAIRLIQADVPAEELAGWKSNLIAPSARNLLDSFNGFNNISVWQRGAVASMALLLNDSALWHEAVWGDRGVAAILCAATTRDGLWNEGTFGYSEYVVYALLPFLHEAAVYGKQNEVEPIRQAAHNLLVAPLALRFPDGTLPNPGDNRGEPMAFKRYLLREAAYLLPTQVGVVEWLSAKTWPRLYVDWNPEISAPAPLPLESRRMDDTGFAMLRHQGWHLFLHFGQASRNHAQYEALSFELHHDKGRIVTDLGTTVYSSPLHQNYFTRAAAHNVPIVDDRGQNRFALGQLLSFEPTLGRMSAQQPDYQPGVSVTRQFMLDAQSVADVIEVNRSQAPGGTIGTILHMDCDLALPKLQGATRPSLPAESGFGYWQQTEVYRLPARFEFNATCGTMALRVQVDGPTEGVMLVGKPPVLDKRNRSAIYVRYPVSQGRIQTTYTLLPSPQKRVSGMK